MGTRTRRNTAKSFTRGMPGITWAVNINKCLPPSLYPQGTNYRPLSLPLLCVACRRQHSQLPHGGGDRTQSQTERDGRERVPLTLPPSLRLLCEGGMCKLLSLPGSFRSSNWRQTGMTWISVHEFCPSNSLFCDKLQSAKKNLI